MLVESSTTIIVLDIEHLLYWTYYIVIGETPSALAVARRFNDFPQCFRNLVGKRKVLIEFFQCPVYGTYKLEARDIDIRYARNLSLIHI